MKLGMKYEYYLAFGYVKHRKSIPESPTITSIPEMGGKAQTSADGKAKVGFSTYMINFTNIVYQGSYPNLFQRP